MTDLHNQRREYLQASLRRNDLSSDPFDQFNDWFNTTLKDEGQIDATCMQLATVSSEGQPHSRIVLLKELRKDGFVFFTSYQSQKGHDIADNPKVGLSFAWNRQERQIHIEGIARKISTGDSDQYFQSRPLDSQRAACLATQSSVIDSKEQLMTAFEALQAQDVIERPEDWGGYVVEPTRFEFWQGGPARIHDRFVYEPMKDGWEIKRLAP